MENQRESKYQKTNEVLKRVNLAWKKLDEIEKETEEIFGYEHLATESIGFAAVHLMNAVMEIEDRLAILINKLSGKSINQIMDVIFMIKYSGANNIYKVQEVFQNALECVSKKYQIERNTVADLCTRRLGFTGAGATDNFLHLVANWLFKNDESLKMLIKKHSAQTMHQKIEEFFNSGGRIQ